VRVSGKAKLVRFVERNERRAKEMGITEQDVDRLFTAYRTENRQHGPLSASRQCRYQHFYEENVDEIVSVDALVPVPGESRVGMYDPEAGNLHEGKEIWANSLPTGIACHARVIPPTTVPGHANPKVQSQVV
jgi:hypothetical protein